MGLIETMRLKAVARKEKHREQRAKASAHLREELARQKAILTEKKSIAEEKKAIATLRSDIRKAKLEPLRNFAGGLQKGARVVRKELRGIQSKQNKNVMGLPNKPLYENTKTADELLGFPTKKEYKADMRKPKVRKKIVNEYR